MPKFAQTHPAFRATRIFETSAPGLQAGSPSGDNANIEDKKVVEVDFRELADGTLVETIEDPNDPSNSLLAIFEDGKVRYAEKLAHNDQLLVPLPKNSGIVRNVMFANGAEDFESPKELFESTVAFLYRIIDLSLEQYALIASYILSTWVAHKLPIAPYLALVGPPGSGKTTVLRALQILCRRTLLTPDISSAAFYEICDQMTTTLLIDETATVNNRKELFHLLRAGSTPGFVSIRRNRSYKSYGPRVVTWTELPNDAALNSRCVLISMKCSERENLLRPDDPLVLQIAEKARRQFLKFRFVNHKTSTFPKIVGEEELQPRARDLFRCLAFPLRGENDLLEALVSILKSQQSLRELLSPEQSAAVHVLFDHIHTVEGTCNVPGRQNNVYLKSLTEFVNRELDQRGEIGTVSDKKMGAILTSLGLTNRTRTNEGYVLWLDRAARKQIHAFVRTHGNAVDLAAANASDGDLCQPTVVTPTHNAANPAVQSGSPTRPISRDRKPMNPRLQRKSARRTRRNKSRTKR